MVTIQFTDRETERRAIGILLRRFSGLVTRSGAHRVPEAAIARGTSFGAPTEAESELAELIIAAMPSIEKVRLVNSGTEVTMSALRLARGFTGRDVVIKFAGNYHGHVDSLLLAAGSSAA